MKRRRFLRAAVTGLAVGLMAMPVLAADGDPLVDVHIHYSHDAWEALPPQKAVAVLRNSGLARAFVSSSSDAGTQKLHALAPDLVVPVLRPYRRRGELSTWMHDATVGDMLAELIARNRYAGIGEFHVFGADADLPLLRRVVKLAEEHGLFLHAHSDAQAIDRIFAQDPDALVLWAHSGFEQPEVIDSMLKKYLTLWADLAFRSEHIDGDRVEPGWQRLFETHPTRFMLGTDTFVPERWHFVEVHAQTNRRWLASLPAELAARIAGSNALELLARTGFETRSVRACAPAGDAELLLDGDGVTAVVSFEPSPPRVGEHVVARVRVCDAAGRALDVPVAMDATMPAHGHGMNYVPRVETVATGVSRIEGLLFHMPGAWEIALTVGEGGERQRLTGDLEMGLHTQ